MHRTFKISVDPELCKGCGYCCSVCPIQILRLSDDFNSMGYRYTIVENDGECTGCGFCVVLCPEIAIEIESSDRFEDGWSKVDG